MVTRLTTVAVPVSRIDRKVVRRARSANTVTVSALVTKICRVRVSVVAARRAARVHHTRVPTKSEVTVTTSALSACR